MANNNNNIDIDLEPRFLIPYDFASETPPEQLIQQLEAENASLKARIDSLTLANEHLQNVSQEAELNYRKEKKMVSEYSRSYHRHLTNPIKVHMNETFFWFDMVHASYLQNKYGCEALKFMHGKLNEKVELPFTHQYSFGEIVDYGINTDTTIEALVTYESRDYVEILMPYVTYIDANTSSSSGYKFESVTKDSVKSLTRRVFTIEYVHVLRMMKGKDTPNKNLVGRV